MDSESISSTSPTPPIPITEAEPSEHKVTRTELSMSFSGPLPPPSTLSAYEDAYPGAADRILKMAESSLHHAMNLEEMSVRSQIESAREASLFHRRGQAFGLTMGLGGLTTGVLCIIFGGPIGGGITGALFGAGGIAILMGVFVYDQKNPPKKL